jgi:DNA-binding response OmpR family regulator
MSEFSKARIMVIDDNTFHLRIVEDALTKANFEAIRAVSGEEALAKIEADGLPDLAIVDYTMDPGMNGFQFCRIIHEYSDLPEALVARSQRVLNRVGLFPFRPAARVVVDGRLSVNFAERNAYTNGQAISLTPTETRLLYILMREAGEVVNTDFIIRRLWPLEPAFEDRLHVHMHRLRRKIEVKEDISFPRYIESRRGEGYLFRKTEGANRFPAG